MKGIISLIGQKLHMSPGPVELFWPPRMERSSVVTVALRCGYEITRSLSPLAALSDLPGALRKTSRTPTLRTIYEEDGPKLTSSNQTLPSDYHSAR